MIKYKNLYIQKSTEKLEISMLQVAEVGISYSEDTIKIIKNRRGPILSSLTIQDFEEMLRLIKINEMLLNEETIDESL